MTAVLALAFMALACLGDVLRPAMAAAADPHCFGVACDDRIGCGQPASPSVSPTSTAHSILLVFVSGVPDLAPEAAAVWAVWLSAPSRDRQPIAPFAPRSPPLV
jgi:hypothetical protein